MNTSYRWLLAYTAMRQPSRMNAPLPRWHDGSSKSTRRKFMCDICSAMSGCRGYAPPGRSKKPPTSSLTQTGCAHLRKVLGRRVRSRIPSIPRYGADMAYWSELFAALSRGADTCNTPSKTAKNGVDTGCDTRVTPGTRNADAIGGASGVMVGVTPGVNAIFGGPATGVTGVAGVNAGVVASDAGDF